MLHHSVLFYYFFICLIFKFWLETMTLVNINILLTVINVYLFKQIIKKKNQKFAYQVWNLTQKTNANKRLKKEAPK